MPDPFGVLRGGLTKHGVIGRWNRASGWEAMPPGTSKQVVAYDTNLLPGAVSLDNTYLTINAWTAWTPTITSGTGTFTSVAGSGAYILIGKLFMFRLLISITTNGTAATDIRFPLPLSLTANGAQAVTATLSTWITLSSWIQTGSGVVITTKYDSTYPGANNTFPILSGSIEVS